MTDEQLIAEGYADGLPVIQCKSYDDFLDKFGIRDAVDVVGELITDADIREAQALERRQKPLVKKAPHGKV